MPGTLYIVATPIGNLKDITFRAIETLKNCHLIACEDTRHTKKLLTHYGIQRPTISYFEHNKFKKGELLIEHLREGQDIALVSDSGMPGISDPGYNIIRSAIENNIQVKVIPGPSAFVTALVQSGMPTDAFVFQGFLSPKSGKRRRQLESLKEEKRTIILYESPHRLLKTLEDILLIMGDRDIVICRELTKIFEEVLRFNVSSGIRYFKEHSPRGEFILILKGNIKD